MYLENLIFALNGDENYLSLIIAGSSLRYYIFEFYYPNDRKHLKHILYD